MEALASDGAMEAVHEAMEALASDGAIPITKKTQRKKFRRVQRNVTVPEHFKLALQHYYIHPDGKPPSGYLWAFADAHQTRWRLSSA